MDQEILDTGHEPEAGEQLPGYSSTRPAPRLTPQPLSTTRSEHSYSLEDTKGRKWLSLFVKSRSVNTTSPPLYLGSDRITGRVELDIEKPVVVKAVTISVQAGTTAVGQEELSFLDVEQTLWPPASNGKTSSKLKGQFSWPFSFTLPDRVSVGKQGSFPLPPNYSERASPAYLDYRFVVKFKRGTLKVDKILTANFALLPFTRPDLPSRLRQLAYQEGSGLVGPEGDPEGWKVLAPVTVKGKLFDVKDVEVTVTLAIATPLSYAIGFPLPLLITLKGVDTQALDVLSAPSSIRLHLVRSLAIGQDAIDDNVIRRSSNFFLESVGLALFWPSNEGAPEEGTKILMGEMEIKKGLKPSFIFPKFSVRYSLNLLPLEAPGFVPSSNSLEPLIVEKVAIVTLPAPGVSARSYAPPGYEKPEAGDYNKAMGFLENGNQRFYHHSTR